MSGGAAGGGGGEGRAARPPVDEGTKLRAVLEAWPQAEAALRALAPRLRVLDDPVVRKAFTRAATLAQVAAAVGVPAALLLARLAEAGVPVAPAAATPPAQAGRPAWADEARVTGRRDARADIAAGAHPLPLVMKDLEALGPGDVYALLTPLLPAPLLALARERGFEAWSAPAGEGPVRTYFRRVG